MADVPPTIEAAVLGNAEQIVAERTMVDLLADPEVLRIQRELERELSVSDRARTEQGRAALKQAVTGWTATLIMRELAADPVSPRILWTTDDSPHSWHGFSVPGRMAYADNPDFIYRATFFEGSGSYAITGQFDLANRPAQLTIEFMRSTPGDRKMADRKEASSDLGNQIAMLTERDLKIDADGRFRIIVNGNDHPEYLGEAAVTRVALSDEPVGVTFRDALSDWNQTPVRLDIRRLRPPLAEARDAADVRSRLLEDMPGHIRFWGTFPDFFFKNLKLNEMTGPFARDGGWGYIASLHFDLGEEQAIIVRTGDSGAQYTGAQISNAWGVTPDVQKYFSSINKAQAIADPDGGFTYVASAKDPGCANWLDTSSVSGSGGLALRWQGMEPGATGDGLVRGYRIVDLGELDTIDHCTRVSPVEREAAMAQRIRDFRARLGE